MQRRSGAAVRVSQVTRNMAAEKPCRWVRAQAQAIESVLRSWLIVVPLLEDTRDDRPDDDDGRHGIAKEE